MKRILTVIALLAFAVPSSAQTWHKDYAKATDDSQKTGKPVLWDFITDDCPYCDKLAVAFKDKRVAPLLSRFVLGRLHEKDNPKVVKYLRVSSYPTMFVSDSDGNILAKQIGYLAPDPLARFLERNSMSADDTLMEILEPADDIPPQGWPGSVARPRGLLPYLRARFTQSIFKLESTPTIDRVSRRLLLPKWQMSGGMEGVKGFKSDVYKLVPTVEVNPRTYQPNSGQTFQALLPVKNSFGRFQNEWGYSKEYPDGTIFVDNLTNAETGNPFETRVAEKNHGQWRRYVAFRDEFERPQGYAGLKGMTCATCHNKGGDGPGSGGYGVGMVPGADTIVSDPFEHLEQR